MSFKRLTCPFHRPSAVRESEGRLDSGKFLVQAKGEGFQIRNPARSAGADPLIKCGSLMLMHHLGEVLSEHVGKLHGGFLPNEGEHLLFCLAQTCWIAQQEPD